MKTSYDKFPVVQVTQRDEDCVVEWQAIAGAVKSAVSGRERSLPAMAAVGKYRISPVGEATSPLATIKAYVRGAAPTQR